MKNGFDIRADLPAPEDFDPGQLNILKELLQLAHITASYQQEVSQLQKQQQLWQAVTSLEAASFKVQQAIATGKPYPSKCSAHHRTLLHYDHRQSFEIVDDFPPIRHSASSFQATNRLVTTPPGVEICQMNTSRRDCGVWRLHGSMLAALLEAPMRALWDDLRSYSLGIGRILTCCYL